MSFQGPVKVGAFDIPGDLARKMLLQPTNINDRSNSDVIVPWVNGLDLTRRPRDMFIIDFGSMPESEAAAYEVPFTHIEEHVRPVRERNRRKLRRERWWLHGELNPAMRASLAPLARFIGTTRVAKHRLFGWFSGPTIPDSATIAIARQDDYAFGVLPLPRARAVGPADGDEPR